MRFIDIHGVPVDVREPRSILEEVPDNTCLQCGREMNPVEVLLGNICGKCCKANHRRVTKVYSYDK